MYLAVRLRKRSICLRYSPLVMRFIIELHVLSKVALLNTYRCLYKLCINASLLIFVCNRFVRIGIDVSLVDLKIAGRLLRNSLAL